MFIAGQMYVKTIDVTTLKIVKRFLFFAVWRR